MPLSTVSDSIAAPVHMERVSPEWEAPYQTHREYTAARMDYVDGLLPRERTVLPGYDSVTVAVTIGLLLLVSLNFMGYAASMSNLVNRLLSVRRRKNLFTEPSVSLTRTIVSLVLVTCLSESILIFSAVRDSASPVFSNIGLLGTLIGCTVVYYVGQNLVYTMVGRTFADRADTSLWVQGFNASQMLMGLCLIPPSLITLFYPGATAAMCVIGAILYIAARFIFIFKGFKIFYRDLFSLVYFILYLCTLEIAPILVIYHGRDLICSL